CMPIRLVTEKIASRNGTIRNTTQKRECANAAPAMVAVTTAEGSRFADPVTTPGPSRQTFQLFFGRASPSVAGNLTTLPRSSGEPFLGGALGNFGKFTP